MKSDITEKTVENIDDYISLYPVEIGKRLEKIRQIIKKNIPEAEEVIGYQMPAFKYHGILVYFAAFKNHIGFYPTSTGIEAFKQELSEYKSSKGAVQFPHEKPLPLDLIKRIVVFRVMENETKALLKNKKKK